MHFLLDANLPRSLIAVIQTAGHTCTHVRDTALAAASDAKSPPTREPPGWRWYHATSILPTYATTHRTSMPELWCFGSPRPQPPS
ncbi:MAG: DUF5615 family PIN-like protein [Phycisphaerae bacterium]|nr:DUF5615 family PIN-like protein [Phycisphaerae bacterium]